MSEVLRESCVRKAILSVEKHPSLSILLIFIGLFSVYAVIPEPWWSGDMTSNSLFAFNVLEYRTIYLDVFPEETTSFWRARPGALAAGHITLNYPPGAAIVTFPLYIVFYIWYQLIGAPAPITSVGFEPYRMAFSHLSAAFLSAATVALLFVILRRRFSTRTALIVAGVLGLASYQWGLLAQSLQQHGPSSFVTLVAAYFLLRASDARTSNVLARLGAAGALAGLLYFIRPTNLAFAAALMTFAVLTFRARGIVFTVMLSVALTWNWVFFKDLTGSAISQHHSFNLSLATFFEAFVGIMFSPSRGLIPTQPFLLFAAAGVVAAVVTLIRAAMRWDFSRRDPDALLFSLLLGACGVLLAAYSFSPFWPTSGYGIRYLSETLPFVCYFLAFSPTVQGHAPVWRRVVFGVFVAIGVVHQITAVLGGMSGHQTWASIPYGELDLPTDRRWDYLVQDPLRRFETRNWDFKDTLLVRIWRGLYAHGHELNAGIVSQSNYAARCHGTVVEAKDGDGRGLEHVMLKMPDGTFYDSVSARRKFVRVRIRNDGPVPLPGYITGLRWGWTAMTHHVFDESGKQVYENGQVYLKRSLKPGETGDAIGIMDLPLERGRYRVAAKVAMNGVGYCGGLVPLGTLVIE